MNHDLEKLDTALKAGNLRHLSVKQGHLFAAQGLGPNRMLISLDGFMSLGDKPSWIDLISSRYDKLPFTSSVDVDDLADNARAVLLAGGEVGINCDVGLNRSSVLMLVLAARMRDRDERDAGETMALVLDHMENLRSRGSETPRVPLLLLFNYCLLYQDGDMLQNMANVIFNHPKCDVISRDKWQGHMAAFRGVLPPLCNPTPQVVKAAAVLHGRATETPAAD